MNFWLAGQRVGHLSYVVETLHEGAPQFDRVLRRLEPFVLGEPRWSASKRVVRLRSLPPATLALLGRAVARLEPEDSEMAGMRTEIDEAFQWLLSPTPGDSGGSRLNRVQTWAAHALSGSVSSAWLARIGGSFFRFDWLQWGERDAFRGRDSLDLLLETLRDPWTTTAERCATIESLVARLPNKPAWAVHHIEQYLFDQMFFFPLLVVGGSAISLPVALDVSFTGFPRGDPLSIVGRSGPVSVRRWSSQLRRCVTIGKQVWRAKHGNRGAFRDLVMSNRTVVAFDFRYAQRVAAPLVGCGLEVKDGTDQSGVVVDLSDRSADAYFAQAVLQRLLGHTTMQVNACTGIIGKRLTDPDSGQPVLNYGFDLPAAVDALAAKLDYAFASRRFERIVLPKGAEPVLTSQLRQVGGYAASGQTAEVRFVEDLHTMADVMQVHGWRQTQYVRCPEVAWAVHNPGQPGFTSPEDEGSAAADVRAVLASFADPDAPPVREMRRPALCIASALWHLNAVARAKLVPIPPALSWAFIRVREYEQDTRFWRTVWHVVGAPITSYHALLRSQDAQTAAKRVAAALNAFSPDADRPRHRAPDVIVLLGSDLFGSSLAEAVFPCSRPLAVAPILDELVRGGLLYPSPHGRLLGSTRIVLVPVEAESDVEPASVLSLDFREHAQLRLLAAFDGGFTQGMAAAALAGQEVRGNALRAALLSLVEKGALRYGQGRYHLPPEARALATTKNNTSESLRAQAEVHYWAGCALAPYAGPEHVSGLALDASFAPEHVHEARYHLRESFRASQRAAAIALQNRARYSLQQLELLTALPTWATVRDLTQSNNLERYACDMARKLIESSNREAGPLHPVHYVQAARAMAARARKIANSIPLESRGLNAEADALFQQAYDACDTFPTESRRARLYVLSYRAEFIMDTQPELAAAMMNELCKAALPTDELPSRAGPSFSGRAFEFAGDRDSDHRSAVEYYSLGTRLAGGWAQLWLKALGAATIGGRVDIIEALDSALSDPADALNRLAKSKAGHTRDRQHAPRHVLDRWQAGLEAARERWGNDPAVVSLIRSHGR